MRGNAEDKAILSKNAPDLETWIAYFVERARVARFFLFVDDSAREEENKKDKVSREEVRAGQEEEPRAIPMALRSEGGAHVAASSSSSSLSSAASPAAKYLLRAAGVDDVSVA